MKTLQLHLSKTKLCNRLLHAGQQIKDIKYENE